jgi:diaminopimelate decarboxylase
MYFNTNYSRNPVPSVVLVHEGKSQLIVKRQIYEDILRNDLIPESLI